MVGLGSQGEVLQPNPNATHRLLGDLKVVVGDGLQGDALQLSLDCGLRGSDGGCEQVWGQHPGEVGDALADAELEDGILNLAILQPMELFGICQLGRSPRSCMCLLEGCGADGGAEQLLDAIAAVLEGGEGSMALCITVGGLLGVEGALGDLDLETIPGTVGADEGSSLTEGELRRSKGEVVNDPRNEDCRELATEEVHE